MNGAGRFASCRALLQEGKRRLLESGIQEAETDARLLFCFVYGTEWSRLLLHYEDAPEVLLRKRNGAGMSGAPLREQRGTGPERAQGVSERTGETETPPETAADAERRYLEAIRRRAAHAPLQYITHGQFFCGFDFYVNESVLIPRQDTEILVETVLKDGGRGALLDLCTGSGCIAVALAKRGSFSEVTAADISEAALAVAAENARRNDVRIALLHSDLFSASGERCFDVITANPPYIRTEDIGALAPEVREHEPRLALDGAADGLLFYRRLAGECPSRLKRGGRIYFEIGCDQAEAVQALLSAQGFTELRCVKDLNGLDRVVSGRIGHV